MALLNNIKARAENIIFDSGTAEEATLPEVIENLESSYVTDDEVEDIIDENILEASNEDIDALFD